MHFLEWSSTPHTPERAEAGPRPPRLQLPPAGGALPAEDEARRDFRRFVAALGPGKHALLAYGVRLGLSEVLATLCAAAYARGGPLVVVASPRRRRDLPPTNGRGAAPRQRHDDAYLDALALLSDPGGSRGHPGLLVSVPGQGQLGAWAAAEEAIGRRRPALQATRLCVVLRSAVDPEGGAPRTALAAVNRHHVTGWF